MTIFFPDPCYYYSPDGLSHSLLLSRFLNSTLTMS